MPDESPAIRPARAGDAGDAAAIARLLAQLGYPASAAEIAARLAALPGPDNVVLLAERSALAPDAPHDGGPTLGLAALHVMPAIHAAAPNGYITAFVVDETARGLGVGRALIAAAEAWARTRGCRRLTVTSAEPREGAHRFYPAVGVPYTGRRYSKTL